MSDDDGAKFVDRVDEHLEINSKSAADNYWAPDALLQSRFNQLCVYAAGTTYLDSD